MMILVKATDKNYKKLAKNGGSNAAAYILEISV